jgi:hypothetical protein
MDSGPRGEDLMKNYVLALLALMAVLGAIVSCSSSSMNMQGTWVDESRQGEPMDDFLVIGVSDSTENRRAFENALVSELQKRQLRATPSVVIMPADQIITRETVLEAIEGRKIDAVLVTRLIGVDTTYSYTPEETYVLPDPYYEKFYAYYSRSYETVHEPGYLVEDTVVSLETNLYETKGEKLVWSGVSKSFNPADANEVISALSKLIVDTLVSEGLVKKR